MKINTDEFKECLDLIGFEYSNEQFEDVIFDITDAEFYVTMSAYTKKIDCWKIYQPSKFIIYFFIEMIDWIEGDPYDIMKEDTVRLVEAKKKLLDSKKKNILIRPMSSTNFGINRPFSGISAISVKSKETMASQQDGKL